jgi:DNA-binding SARP family transcriptional activator/Tfp pilus assembly protein PilF
MQSDASHFQMRLLTGFEFEKDGQRCEIPGQKSKALFCVLALQPGKPVARSFLGDLLWDGIEPDQRSMNLRQTLTVIKRALGDDYDSVLAVNKQTLMLRPEHVDIDARSLTTIDATAPNDLQLFGAMGVRSRSFEVWLSDQQNQIVKGTIQRTSRALIKALEAGEHEAALSLATRLIAFEPDEPSHIRQLHIILLALGRHHDARQLAKENPDIDLEQVAANELRDTPSNENSAPVILIGRFNRKPDDRAATHIAIALSEAVVGDLSESAWVRVVAPDLTNLSAPMFGLVATQQNAMRWSYRLDGAIQSDPLSASIWLTNGADQTVVWTQKFTANSVGKLADDIVSRVTGSLESIILDQEGKRATHTRTIAGYWEDLARARSLFWRASHSANQEAETLLDNMLENSPHDVRVLTLAAYAKLMNAWSGWEGATGSNLDQAARFARRAIQSVPDDAWSLMTMATVLSARLDLVGARRKLELALSIRPHLAAAKGELARVLVFNGQTKQGAVLASEALDASPRDPHASLWLRTQALAHWMDGQFDHAAELAQLAIEKRTNWYPNFLLSAIAHGCAGNQSTARAAIASARSLGSDGLSQDALRCGHPFADRLVFDRFMRDLRAAGWEQS